MCVGRSRFHTAMAEKHLYRSQIGSVFEQVSSKAVPKRMRRDILAYACLVHRPLASHPGNDA